jgi:hypothetical protein
MQLTFRPSGPETIATYLTRLAYRMRFYRFFFLPPLYIALVAFLFALREFRFAWVALTLVIFALGVNFFPAFQFHYIAAATCLFVLVSITGLQQLSRLTIRGLPAGNQAARLIVYLCAVHFIFWYGLHIFDTADFSLAMRRYETWDSINHDNPERRIEVNQQLAKIPDKLLVFVRYSPRHIFQDEWVYNEADIDLRTKSCNITTAIAPFGCSSPMSGRPSSAATSRSPRRPHPNLRHSGSSRCARPWISCASFCLSAIPSDLAPPISSS